MSPVTVVINKILLGWVAFGAGFAVAGGFIAFISLIGIVTRLAGITKTADHIPVYENSMAMGILLFNLLSLYQPYFPDFSYGRIQHYISVKFVYRDFCRMSCRGIGRSGKYYSYLFTQGKIKKRISLYGKSGSAWEMYRLSDSILSFNL